MMKTFFVCPNCGNTMEFKIFTRNFQIIKQSPELGIRTEASSSLPSLRQDDNYIECQSCFQRFEYDDAAALGKKYLQTAQLLQNTPHQTWCLIPGDETPSFLSTQDDSMGNNVVRKVRGESGSSLSLGNSV